MPSLLSDLNVTERRRVVNGALRMVAARKWHDLGRHALAQLPEVAQRRQEAGYPDAPSGAGQALRDVLARAIDGLRPDPNAAPDPADRLWRSHLILRRCFLEGKARNAVADSLFIERGTYDHEQIRALNELADRLAELGREGIAAPAFRRAAPPPPLQGVLGRERVLAEIKRRLASGARALAVHGLPGIGKTTLLASLAGDAELTARFPDGILWTALGSHGDAGAALSEWAIALGAPTHEIGALGGLAERARAAHDAIGAKRVLLIADDVWDPAAALALRVGGPGSACVISTRSPAIAVDFAGAGAIAIDALGDDDALSLLSRFAPEAVRDRPDAAREVCAAVGGLPLALTLIGGRLRHVGHAGQARRITSELDHLRAAETRLDLSRPESLIERRPGMPEGAPTTLSSVIALSDEQLGPPARAAWYALAVFPAQPNNFDENAALAVSAGGVDALDALVDAGMLEAEADGRFRMHQTIADYGRLRLAAQPDHGAAARARFAGYYTALCEEAIDDDARLAPEQANALAALEVAYAEGLGDCLIRGANSLSRMLLTRGEYAEAERHLQRASLAAEAAGGGRALAAVLMNLGFVRVKRGFYAEATALFERGLALARSAGERRLAATLLQHLGHVATDLARYDDARARYDECLAIARAEGDQRRIVEALFFKALMHDQHSDFGEAERCLNEALPLARATGHREFEATCVSGLGVVACKRGQIERGLDLVRQGMAMSRGVGHKEGIAVCCFVLGFGTQALLGEAEADVYYREGLALAREIGHSRLMAMLLAAQGELLAQHGPASAGQARAMCDEAVEIARRAGHGHELSFALEQRASLRTWLGEYAAGARDCEAAIAEARRIRSPEREAFAMARLAVNQVRGGAPAAAALTAARSLALLGRIGFGPAQIVSYLRRARALA
ncbi:MAG TPA: tetratricopeptide repeat protein [Thermoflexales bacterium]|nr:tetratricopeptide repeat protein [Thermoflexales bacterium]